MQGNELIEANLADAHAILSEVREICEGMAAGRLSPGAGVLARLVRLVEDSTDCLLLAMEIVTPGSLAA